MWGVVVGLAIGAVFAVIGDRQRTAMLRLKAVYANRTPEKIGDGFFYIVPESEYVVLDGLRIEARRVLDQWNAGARRGDAEWHLGPRAAAERSVDGRDIKGDGRG